MSHKLILYYAMAWLTFRESIFMIFKRTQDLPKYDENKEQYWSELLALYLCWDK